MPIYPFLGEGSPTKIDYRKKGTLMLTFLLEDLVYVIILCLSRLQHGCGSKMRTENGTLVKGTKDKNLLSPGGF